MKFKPICLTRQCFNLHVCLDTSLGTLKPLKEAHARIIVSEMLSEQPGQGSHPGEISAAPGLSAELAVVLCQQDPAAVTAALFQWEWCLSQSSISRAL